ncbi:MAG: malto-oligosyltrehalose synthase, partial [Candidatus Omnitrophica bacterium]|nr:malto-oligosyltrehalose synthase [Candidatus Omnitrophota bacterium]
MTIPLATYRLQLGPDLTFEAARDILPYLKQLGVSHIYASPILQTTEGSTHGYDVVDPRKIDAELGGEKGFERISKRTKELGLGWIQDIVPNHMAFDSSNRMLM